VTNDAKRLGYGGSAEIAGKQVLVTSGSFSVQPSPSFIEAVDISPTAVSRSKMLHADGVEAYTGDISLDVTDDFLTVLTTTQLLGRRFKFKVGIHDGEKGQEMGNCFVTSLNLLGAAGGLVTAQLGVASASKPSSSLSVANSFIRDDEPLGYWNSGNTAVRDWSLAFSQAVTPVYGNLNGVEPKYLKVGLASYTLQVTTYESLQAHKSIQISTKTFTLTGVTSSSGYSFGGLTELGMYLHTFETAADATVGSGGVVIA
jgi:hypothetical protein